MGQSAERTLGPAALGRPPLRPAPPAPLRPGTQIYHVSHLIAPAVRVRVSPPVSAQARRVPVGLASTLRLPPCTSTSRLDFFSAGAVRCADEPRLPCPFGSMQRGGTALQELAWLRLAGLASPPREGQQRREGGMQGCRRRSLAGGPAWLICLPGWLAGSWLAWLAWLAGWLGTALPSPDAWTRIIASHSAHCSRSVAMPHSPLGFWLRSKGKGPPSTAREQQGVKTYVAH